MIETVNERYERFISEMRELGLLYDNDPSLPFLRLGASLYNDYESSLLLESNIIDDAHLTDLEIELDPSFISLPLGALSSSSSPIASNISDSTLLASPHPLAQCMVLEMSEISRDNASVLEDV